ncbi:MAG TPA: Kdo hydroxylase family protein [Acidobacteriaceae bacterium]|nr:Kdo hydroxylase family protein [Acidobacteriaceae bacterium]
MPVVTIPSSGLMPAPEQSRALCAQLEAGDILYFPETPVPLSPDDSAFLLGQQQSDSSLHKNIAYKPNIDRLSGVDTKTADPAAVARLQQIMRGYSTSVVQFLTRFLSPYQQHWKLDYASFRPQEEQNRDLPLRRRNDLLHTDAFPTRPTHGARILRFFNNINPTRTRDWIVSDPFAALVRRFAPQEIAPHPDSPLSRAGKAAGRALGLGAAIPSLKRSPYDDFMMRFHNFLKENPRFQSDCPKYPFQFPPGSSWMVYTDTVPHAVLAGQYALEQTFLVRPEAMVRPEVSPLKVLEEIAQAPLV